VDGWAAGLAAIGGITTTVDPRNEAGQPVPRLHLGVSGGASRIVAALREGEPSILVLPDGDAGFWIGPDQLVAGEADTVLKQVRTALVASGTVETTMER
jgi:hypothetical protein